MNILVENLLLENKPLSNVELIESAKILKIPNFRGVYLRDTLPKRPKREECGIFNLDNSNGSGTHWVAWFKKGNCSLYFDSYGLPPPNELLEYIKKDTFYNTEQIQQPHQVICGHLCLFIICELNKGKEFQQIINDLY